MTILDTIELELEQAAKIIAQALADLRSITREELSELGKQSREPRYRSAVTGFYVTQEYALANPDTTVRET